MYLQLLLVACLVAGTQAAYLRGKEEALGDFMETALLENVEEFETDLADNYCDAASLGPIEINECIEKQRQHEVCDYFKESYCNGDCLLGHERDDHGCIVSCRCAQEGLFEGDILVQRQQLDDLEAMYSISSYYRAASRFKMRWDNIKNADGNYEIPYVYSDAIKKSPDVLKAIQEAFEQYALHTCLRFTPWMDPRQRDYIEFVDAPGCYSAVGRSGGPQKVGLGKQCASKGVVMHELMHAIGFWHEQARPDRDQYVRILSNNIIPSRRRNFKKMSRSEIDSMGSPYDFQSLMHYGGYYFSRNQRPTIVRQSDNEPVTAQRDGFSMEDLIQIKKMYSCGSYGR